MNKVTSYPVQSKDAEPVRGAASRSQLRAQLAALPLDQQERLVAPPRDVPPLQLKTTQDSGGIFDALQRDQSFLPRDTDECGGERGCRTRAWWEGQACYRMSDAFVKYQAACEEHQDRLRQAAQAEAQLAGIAASILIGLAANPLMGTALARFAEDNAISALGSRDLQAARDWIGAMDASPLLVNTATDAALEAAKGQFEQMFQREESEQFLLSLSQVFSVTIDAARTSLPDLTDLEVLATFAAYSPQIITQEYYFQAIADMLQIWSSIEMRVDATPGWHFTEFTAAAWVTGEGENRQLALVRSVEAHTPVAGASNLAFVAWIPPEMADEAIRRTNEVGAPVLSLNGADLEDRSSEEGHSMPRRGPVE